MRTNQSLDEIAFTAERILHTQQARGSLHTGEWRKSYLDMSAMSSWRPPFFVSTFRGFRVHGGSLK